MPGHGTRTEPGGSDESKSALVLDIIQGKTIVAEASPQYDLSPSEVEQYECHLKDLQEAYGEAMLELRARKNCSPCWTGTRSDRDDPPGTASRRHHRLDRQAVPLVQRAAAHGLLSDNGLVCTSRSYTALVRGYGLRQDFITPHCPQQNGMIERVIRTLKEQCAHRHRFETIHHASRVVGGWIRFYNRRCPHRALGMKTRAQAFALAA
ncbi:integrase core domain protein [Bordetella bronchiseptica MBORD901]|nr:integrase core domain protein [Bordetella bronchiseptica MBORD901]